MNMFSAYVLKDNKLILEENLSIGEIPEKHVLVNIKACGVNRADILLVKGKYSVSENANEAGKFIPGLEFSGVIANVNSCSRDLKVGDRVCGLTASGAYSEKIIVHEDLLIKIPDSISFLDAASIPESWATAYFNLFLNGGIKSGDTVLIHSAGGGVGLSAIQLAKNIGANVYATSGADSKIEKIKHLGVIDIFNYKNQSVELIASHYDSKFNIILDTIGASAFPSHIELLSENGKLVLIGLLGGAVCEINLSKLLGKNISLITSRLRSQPLEIKARICSFIEQEVINGIVQSSYKIHRDEVFSFEEIDKAFSHILSNSNFGNVVLSIN